MKLEGAIIERQGIPFALAKVDKGVFDISGRAGDEMISIQRFFPRMAIVFMVADSGGQPNFYGRPDIVKAMMNTPTDDIEWKEFVFEESEAER